MGGNYIHHHPLDAKYRGSMLEPEWVWPSWWIRVVSFIESVHVLYAGLQLIKLFPDVMHPTSRYRSNFFWHYPNISTELSTYIVITVLLPVVAGVPLFRCLALRYKSHWIGKQSIQWEEHIPVKPWANIWFLYLPQPVILPTRLSSISFTTLPLA